MLRRVLWLLLGLTFTGVGLLMLNHEPVFLGLSAERHALSFFVCAAICAAGMVARWGPAPLGAMLSVFLGMNSIVNGVDPRVFVPLFAVAGGIFGGLVELLLRQAAKLNRSET